MPKLNPYLNFPGTAEAAFNFYKSVFGGEFSALVRFKDMPMEGMELPKDVEDQVMHISLPIGNDVLMASDAPPSMGMTVNNGNSAYISVHPETRAEADRLFQGLSAGGAIEMPIADQPWGDYFGSFKDKFGIGWMVNHHPE
jgi:PhnB protein